MALGVDYLVVFTSVTIASLSAGMLQHKLGWAKALSSPSPLL